MTAGFQAFTDTGLVQIDGLTQNYALRQKIVVTTSSGPINAGMSNAGSMYQLSANVANISITAVAPLIAIYSPSANATILKCANAGGNAWNVQIWSDSPASVEVFIFDQSVAAAPSGAGYGLQVFDASGNLVADARQRLARVLDVQAGNIHDSPGSGWGQWAHIDSRDYSFSYAAAKVGVAAIQNAMQSYPTGGSNNGWYNMSGFNTVGGNVTLHYGYFQQGNTSHPGNDAAYGTAFDWRFMAVDLSNL
ncbi:hypothetical protein [Paraburkholderia xenovorans]|uniref:hypothetical protein n=1 Tax=Paraburkholderia xenovorans TaxID=36873 RepID=UPI0015C53E22|nr:hypothetical protein [Paraburkholderia xenovorans]NPT39678.1 hypothetical protein [Paraburkholderia xenovorans]